MHDWKDDEHSGVPLEKQEAVQAAQGSTAYSLVKKFQAVTRKDAVTACLTIIQHRAMQAQNTTGSDATTASACATWLPRPWGSYGRPA